MIQVQDYTGTLDSAQRADLQATPSPFRTTVVFQDVPKGVMETSMQACSRAPDALCVGVNPHHRFVSVFYGIDVADQGAANTIKKAGNSSFANADWSQGVKDIVVRAEAVGHARQGQVVINQPRVVVDHGVPVAPFVIGFGVLAALVVAIAVSVRRSRRRMEQAAQDVREEAAELASANIARNPKYQPDPAPTVHTAPTVPRLPVVNSLRDDTPAQLVSRSQAKREAIMRGQPMPTFSRQPYYAPPVVTVPMASPVNDFATGVILGQAMSRPAVEREVIVERERPSYSPPSYSPPSYRSPDPDPPSYGGSSDTSDSSGGGGTTDFGSSDSSGGGGSTDF